MSAPPSSTLGTQALRFLAVGVGTLLLDYLTYRVLLAAGVELSPAKLVGFVVGTIATYLVNRTWTFGAGGGAKAVLRFLVLYATTLVLNVTVNAVLVQLLEGSRLRIEVAFLVAQAVSSAVNFAGSRWFVFPREESVRRAGQPAAARAASSLATGTRNGEHDT